MDHKLLINQRFGGKGANKGHELSGGTAQTGKLKRLYPDSLASRILDRSNFQGGSEARAIFWSPLSNAAEMWDFQQDVPVYSLQLLENL